MPAVKDIKILHQVKRTSLPKKAAVKKIRKPNNIKVFVAGFYRRYGKMMSELSHE